MGKGQAVLPTHKRPLLGNEEIWAQSLLLQPLAIAGSSEVSNLGDDCAFVSAEAEGGAELIISNTIIKSYV